MSGSEMSSLGETVHGLALSSRSAAGSDRVQWNRTMRWVRMVHMCLGLLLAPGMILYGLSAFLFNHPLVATDTSRTALSPAEFEGTMFTDLPGATVAAREVVASLARTNVNPATDPSTYALVNPENAMYDRQASYQVRGKDETFRLNFDLDRGDGELLRYPIKTRIQTGPRAEFVRRGLVVGSTPLEATVAAIPTVLSALGIEGIGPGDVELKKPPRLKFEMEADGGRWLVSYDQVRRTVAARPIDRVPHISARKYLLGLHKTNGYPMQTGARSIWAVLVDVTGDRFWDGPFCQPAECEVRRSVPRSFLLLR